MLTGNEISQILLSLILSYHGAHRNRPRWIAWGVAFSALSCFVVALPHFIYGPGTDALELTKEYMGGSIKNMTTSSNTEQLCLEAVRDEHCEAQELTGDFSVLPLVMVFLSQFILGIGNTLYFSLGQTYLDDNTKKTETPVLLGWTLALRTLGPAIGFVLAYICLNIYIDPSKVPMIDKKDPRWLGAWWLGWILLGTIMVVFALLMAMFPQYLPRPARNKEDCTKSKDGTRSGDVTKSKGVVIKSEEAIRKSKGVVKSQESFTYSEESFSYSEASFSKSEEECALGCKEYPSRQEKDSSRPEEELLRKPEDFRTGNGIQKSVSLEVIVKTEIPRFKDFPKALKRLLKNKLLMFNNISGIFYILGASGYITYISKYLEVQFQESATYTVITGPTMLVGMVAGFLISGYLITRYKPGPKYLLGWNVFVGFIFIIGQFIFMELDCPIKDVHSFSGDPKRFQLLHGCNANCSCDNVKYSPVCEVQARITYFSPCHAGCKVLLDGTKQVFTECVCTDPQFRLEDGPCFTDCFHTFIMFVLISFLINFMGSSGRIGNLLVNYRSVDIKDKSFAQGLALWMISLLALIPGPILYGVIIDSTCLVWNVSCGKRRNCYTYDRRKMRVYLNSTAIILTAFGVAFDAVVWYQGRNLNLYENNPFAQSRKLSRSIIKSDKKAEGDAARKNPNNIL